MKKVIVIVVLLSVFLSLFLATGCSLKMKISDIMADPIKYEDRQVSVSGTVGNNFWISLVDKGAYEIGDGTGTIWVVTGEPPPQQGTEVTVSGKVTTAVKLGDKTLGTVIVESGRD